MDKHYVITNGKTTIFNSQTAKEKNEEYHEAMGYEVDESIEATRLLVSKGLGVTEDFKRLEDAGEVRKVEVKAESKKVANKEKAKEVKVDTATKKEK